MSNNVLSLYAKAPLDFPRVVNAKLKLNNYRMSQDHQKSKQEILARAGLMLSFFMFLLGAVVAFFSGASVLIVLVLSISALLLLRAAMFASQKVALFMGRLFPLG